MSFFGGMSAMFSQGYLRARENERRRIEREKQTLYQVREGQKIREFDTDQIAPDPIVSMVEADGTLFVATEKQVFRLSNAAGSGGALYPVRFKGKG